MISVCFICAINNVAILKSVEIATEVKEAAKTAKAQVYSRSDEVQKIHKKKPQQNHHHQHQKSPLPPTKPSASNTTRCYRCERTAMR